LATLLDAFSDTGRKQTNAQRADESSNDRADGGKDCTLPKRIVHFGFLRDNFPRLGSTQVSVRGSEGPEGCGARTPFGELARLRAAQKRGYRRYIGCGKPMVIHQRKRLHGAADGYQRQLVP
jgi:hypothetical protein